MGFPRQEYWSGLPFSLPRALSDPGIEAETPALAGGFFTNAPPGKPSVFSSVQSLSFVRLFVTPWTATCQASISITNSWSLLKLMSITSVMPSNHLIPVIPFSSCTQSSPASVSCPMSQFFTSGGQSIGASASASVLPMNIHN